MHLQVPDVKLYDSALFDTHFLGSFLGSTLPRSSKAMQAYSQQICIGRWLGSGHGWLGNPRTKWSFVVRRHHWTARGGLHYPKTPGTWSRNLGWPLKNDAGFVAGWLQSANVCGRIVPCPGGSLNICDSVERGWFSSYLPGRAWKILQEWLLVENDLQILASILPAQCFVDQRIQWISRQWQQKGSRMQDFWAVNLSIYLCRQNLGHRS